MVLNFGDIYGSIVVIIVEMVGIGVSEAGKRGVNKWAGWEAFRAEVGGVSLLKPGKSGR